MKPAMLTSRLLNFALSELLVLRLDSEIVLNGGRGGVVLGRRV